jgi:hypothetical protein
MACCALSILCSANTVGMHLSCHKCQILIIPADPLHPGPERGLHCPGVRHGAAMHGLSSLPLYVIWVHCAAVSVLR